MSDDIRWFERKPEGGYRQRIFSRDILLKIAALKPPDVEVDDIGMRAYGLALQVLDAFFGRQWSERHIMDDDAQRGFVNRWDGDLRFQTSLRRMIDLAEMLVNFQSIKGVEACFDQVSGGMIESAFAELEAGKILAFSGTKFRYIWPSKIPGQDFDIELQFNSGELGCADVKAKSESTEVTAQTVKNSLQAARQQLPADHPGVIFLKLPNKWATNVQHMVLAAKAASDFLDTTSRVVAAIVFFSVDVFENGAVQTWIHSLEIHSNRHKFDRTLNWRVLRDDPRPPDTWVSLVEVVQEAVRSSG